MSEHPNERDPSTLPPELRARLRAALAELGASADSGFDHTPRWVA
ncbi:MAG: hypothetical protein U5K30_16395 [Acidimicrobiales bacterium]|nr:hypothetical protein [Acidimicrobiales bacterium]